MRDYLYFLSYARDDRVYDRHRTIDKFSAESESQVRMLHPAQGEVSLLQWREGKGQEKPIPRRTSSFGAAAYSLL